MKTARALSPDAIDHLRSELPALETFVWLQNGGVSLTPRPVAQEHARLMAELFERGPMHIAYPEEEYPRRVASRARIASFLGVEPDQVAFTRGISEAFQVVLSGMDWSAGDEILVTAEEEPTILLPCLHLGTLRGIRVVPVPLDADANRQVDHFRRLLSQRTKLIAVSHVTTDTGHRLPISDLVKLARERSIPTFVDTAHSAGLVPLDLGAVGAEFFGVLSYKWMLAPYAAGALVIRRDCLDLIKVRFAGNRAEQSINYDRYSYELKRSAQRFEYGPWSWPLIHTWAFALDYLAAIGVDAVWRRVADLASRMKRSLVDLEGIRLLTPRSAEASAALVSFSVAGWSGRELERELRSRWNIVVRSLFAGLDGVRASVAYFTLEREVDFFVECVGVLAAERAHGRPDAKR